MTAAVNPSPLPPNAAEPSWYRIALAEIGVQEVQGPGDNPRVQEYFGATSMGSHTHDEVAWCSAFANWCIKRSGLPGTGLANARSWLQYGQPLLMPRLGAITVFSAPSRGEAAGHVGFFVEADEHHIRVLGGNQNNRVCVARYPRDRLLAYRWPTMRTVAPPPPANDNAAG